MTHRVFVLQVCARDCVDAPHLNERKKLVCHLIERSHTDLPAAAIQQVKAEDVTLALDTAPPAYARPSR